MKTQKELIFQISLQFVENILLVCPLLYTYIQVKTRHQFLEDTIGPLELEIEAINNFELLLISSITLITVSVPLQALLFWLYNKYGHPWKRFFNEISKISSDFNQDNNLYALVQQEEKDSWLLQNDTFRSYDDLKTDAKLKKVIAVENEASKSLPNLTLNNV